MHDRFRIFLFCHVANAGTAVRWVRDLIRDHVCRHWSARTQRTQLAQNGPRDGVGESVRTPLTSSPTGDSAANSNTVRLTTVRAQTDSSIRDSDIRF